MNSPARAPALENFRADARQKYELTDMTAKLIIYENFVEGKLEGSKHIARTVNDQYFQPRGISIREQSGACRTLPVRVQETGPHRAIQRDCQARRVTRGSLLTDI